jgi:RNA polymerase sigma factor (sigma-70 family)
LHCFANNLVVFAPPFALTSPCVPRCLRGNPDSFQRLAVSIDVKPPDPQQLKTWLQAASKRDAAAFRSLYDATSPKLFGFALRILHKRELAEEILQESFVAIWNNAANYQSHLAAPMTWMATIVRNKAFDHLRRSDVAVEIDAEQFDSEVMNALQDPQATPIEALQMSGDAKALAWCMSALEGVHRQVVALAFYHDLSHSEVAEHMKLPVGTVKTWIRRSLDKLRTCLAKREQA